MPESSNGAAAMLWSGKERQSSAVKCTFIPVNLLGHACSWRELFIALHVFPEFLIPKIVIHIIIVSLVSIGQLFKFRLSSSIARPQEVEVHMENSSFKSTSKSTLVRLLPLFVHDPEGNVLVWRPCNESDDASGTICTLRVLLNTIRRGLQKRRSALSVPSLRWLDTGVHWVAVHPNDRS
jgi:hypothetical protein